ncbi:hypothetical protein ABPG72_014446 [Tetrahymena utriculariae]
MFKKIVSNLKPFVFSITAVGGSFVSYYSYLAYLNRKQFQEQKENDELYKDTTRETNEYFGLSWGYKADYLVKEKMDSGDIFFIKYDCDECLSLKQMIWCNLLQTYKQDQEYDSIGFAYRDANGLFIISNQFGVTKVMEYADFLSQPFLSELSVRKLITKDQTKADSRAFFKNVKAHFQKLKQADKPEIRESSEEFAINYLKSLNILQDSVVKENLKPYISEYDKSKPFFLKPRYSFDNKIIIRSATNKQLNSSNLFTSTASFNK